MPRARPGARKTTARRRIFRYRTKWTHQVIPRRFKVLLDDMIDEYEEAEPPFVECEEPTMAELTVKGVPEAEWPYYLGYMKRMLALYRTYTGETLQLEKTNLIEEYVLRGKERHVLEQVQEVAAECAGVPPVPPFTCEDVLDCLEGIIEGEYTSYAAQWKRAHAGLEGIFNYPVHFDEANNKICLLGNSAGTFTTRDLDTGLNPVVIATLDLAPGQAVIRSKSAHEKYFAYIINIGGKPNIRIYKDGVLLQTIDLSLAPISWVIVWNAYIVNVSATGKYIVIENQGTNEYALIEGS